MVNDDIEQLIAQCKSNDVDVKVDALNKLGPLLDEGAEIPDFDALTTTLKSCLRTSNQLLTAATLSVIPPFARRLSTVTTNALPDLAASTSSVASSSSASTSRLRQALLAFLPAGGIIDRLGEQREKSRETARAALVILAGAAYLAGPAGKQRDVAKGHEPPLFLLEKYTRELGFASKVFRVREQTILALVEIRHLHPMFPLRPYLPQLVECLEDTDGTVRDCARFSVVSLFSGTQVTEAARADLKNEMTKKNVRKAIVNDVLSKLLSGSTPQASTPASPAPETDTSPAEEGGASSSRTTSIKPMVVSRSTTMSTVGRTTSSISVATSNVSEEAAQSQSDITEVFIASARDLEHEFAKMGPCFEGRESEHNWLDREKSIIRIRGMIKGDVYSRYPDAFFSGLKNGVLEKTVKGLLSLRTTLSIHACSLYAELAIAMGTAFDSLVETVLTHLLKMGGFTKKLVAQQSQAAVTQILSHTSAQPRLVLNLLSSYSQEKMVPVRSYVLAHIRTILQVHGSQPHGKAVIEAAGGVDTLDKCIRKGLGDANPGVRDQARSAYWLFNEIWPEDGAGIMASLDATAKKQLERSNPKPGGSSSVAATPAPKKSSVAAAIAASRAKAKIIATAPPTLRHAATAGASAVASSKAASSRREGSPAPTRRIGSPGVSSRVSPPVSPRSPNGFSSPPRTSSSPPSRPVPIRSASTSGAVNGSRSKAMPAMSVPAARPRAYSPSPPTSPTPHSSNYNTRRAASPLGPSAMAKKRSSLGAALPISGRAPLPSKLSVSSLSSDPVEDDLLTAIRIPLPADSDGPDGPDDSINLMSFSSAWETIESSNLKPAPGVPESVIHDNLRAQAQQAESAAAQLLDLVADEEFTAAPLLPAAGIRSASRVPSPPRAGPSVFRQDGPVTPRTKVSALAKAVNGFQNSPPPQSPMLARALFERNDKTGNWWRARRRLLKEPPPVIIEEGKSREVLQSSISKLEDGTADVALLKSLIWISAQHPSDGTPASPPLNATRVPQNGMLTPTSPSPMSGFKRSTLPDVELWDDGKQVDVLVCALTAYLTKDKSEDIIDYGLMLIYELVLKQNSFLTNNENTIFSFLLEIRYTKRTNVFEATNAIRDTLIEKSDPILGLATVHRSLEDYLKKSNPDESLAEVKISTYCFCLVALAKYSLLLPPEILEDELPRVRSTIITALSHPTSANVREAAYVAIIASQIVLRDETQLFALLSGLTETQKNMLTYEFEKLKTRGPMRSDAPDTSLQKLAGRFRHLDALPAPNSH